MKLIESTPSKQFKPFRLTLEIESEEEARLLWHVFNRGNLKDAIFYNYTCRTYNMNIVNQFSCREDICNAISKEVTIEN